MVFFNHFRTFFPLKHIPDPLLILRIQGTRVDKYGTFFGIRFKANLVPGMFDPNWIAVYLIDPFKHPMLIALLPMAAEDVNCSMRFGRRKIQTPFTPKRFKTMKYNTDCKEIMGNHLLIATKASNPTKVYL